MDGTGKRTDGKKEISVWTNRSVLKLFVFFVLLMPGAASALPRAYLVVDQKGEYRARAGEDNRYAIASLAKLATALYAVDNMQPERSIPIVQNTVLRNEFDHSAVLKKGEVYSLRDVLSSMLVASTNVSAVSIASAFGGDTVFLAALNQWSKERGLDSTTFADSFGLSPRTQSSARDVARMLSFVEARPLLRGILSAEKDTIRSRSGRVVAFESTNPLKSYRSYRIYGKTGTTREAGKCFAGFAEAGSTRLKIVILGSRDVARDLKALLDL